MKLLIHIIYLVSLIMVGTRPGNQGIHFSANGTGETTDHIMDLNVENRTAEDVSLELGPWFIPAKTTSPEDGQNTVAEKTNQSYITSGPYHVEIPAGESVTVPIEGYCTNIHLPPVPKGESAIDYTAWIELDPEAMPPAGLIENTSWTSEETRARNPYTGESLPGTIDFEKDPETAAILIHESMERIEETVDSLYAINLIRTPFSGNREKERQTILQQTLWVFTSELSGEYYTQEQFRDRLEEQLLHRMNMTYEELPEGDQKQFDSGTESFWNTFDLVGTESKVILTSGPGEEGEPRIPTYTIGDEPICQISINEIVEPAMDGGLKRAFRISDERIKRDDFIALGAEGRDYDQVEWICTPAQDCRDSRGTKKIPLTGRVKFTWEIIQGEGHFVRLGCLPNINQDEGDHVIFQPPYVPLPEEGRYNRKQTVILLKIIDDNPSQPQDGTVERRITIITERRTGRISEHYYYMTVEAEQYSLPSAPDPEINEGTCQATGPKWDAPNDLNTPVEQRPAVPDRDKMVVGQWMRLHTIDQRDNDQVELECQSNQCESSKEQKQYEDELEWNWEITSRGDVGHFVSGGDSRDRSDDIKGRYVIYEAPGEIDEEEPYKDIEIELTVSNKEGLQLEDAEPEKRSFTIRVYKAGIEMARTPPNWLPERQNTLDLESRLKYNDGRNWRDALAHMCRIHYFELVESSSEKGYCTNAPERDESEKCFDLRLNEENQHEVFNDRNRRDAPGISDCENYRDYMMEARTNEPEREYTITVHSEDYGSYGQLLSHGNINEYDPDDQEDVEPVYTSIPVEANDHPGGRSKKEVYEDNRVTIPRDIDENWIADHGWRASVGNGRQSDPEDKTRDRDRSPTGDGYRSDGYTAYEEYRGFMVSSPEPGHVRTDLRTKDLMIWNEAGFPIGLFRSESELTVFEVDEENFYRHNHIYWSNFNSPTFSDYQQAGLRLCDGGNRNCRGRGGVLGIANTLTGQPAPPNWVRNVAVYSDRINDLSLVEDGFLSYNEKATTVTAHELGHAVNAYHHGEGDGRNGNRSGDLRCIMRYDNRNVVNCQDLDETEIEVDGRTRTAKVEPVGSIFCTGTAGTGYNAGNQCFGNCDTNRGNCKHQTRVSGRSSSYPTR